MQSCVIKEICLKPIRTAFTSTTKYFMSTTTLPVNFILPGGLVRISLNRNARLSKKVEFINKQTYSTWNFDVTRSCYSYWSKWRTNLILKNNNPISLLNFKRINSVLISHECRRNLCSQNYCFQPSVVFNNNGYNRINHCRLLSPPGFSQHSQIWKRGSAIKRGENEGVDRRILLMVYGSCALGALLISTIAYSQLKTLYKRVVHGVHTFTDKPFGRRQKLIKYKDVILPAMLEKTLDAIRKFTVRADDVWVVSWPRSGTTWVQEIVYLIQSDLDIAQEDQKNIEQRFSFLENVYPGLKTIEDSKSPRLIKSHLPFHLLPEQMETVRPKVIYVLRNPKDILISYYSFLKMLKPLKFEGTFDEFCDRFTKDKVYYSPWGKHVRAAWELEKEGANILIVKYEDLHMDLSANIERIAQFLGKKLSSEQISAIHERCQFENMKQNNSVNYSWWDDYGIRDKTQSHFLRKGQVGDWKTHITAFINRRIEKMVQDNLSDTDLVFDYELANQPNDS